MQGVEYGICMLVVRCKCECEAIGCWNLGVVVDFEDFKLTSQVDEKSLTLNLARNTTPYTNLFLCRVLSF